MSIAQALVCFCIYNPEIYFKRYVENEPESTSILDAHQYYFIFDH